MSNLVAPDRRALSEVFTDPRTLRAFEALFQNVGSPSGSSASVVSTLNGAAGSFVNVYDNSGSLGVRLADATDPTKAANGFISDAMTAGAGVTVNFAGMNLLPAVTARGLVWLSETSPGSFQATPPSGAGHIVQPIGYAIPGVGIFFQPAMIPVEL